MTTPTGVKLARKRVATEGWAKKILQQLISSAEALHQANLPVFETQWWKESSKKRWQDIYPEINIHTNTAVAGAMRETTSAAIAYALTGDRRYALTVRRVLLHYSGYEFFARHPDVGMNWSSWCMPALQSYDFIHETLSPEDRSKIDDFFGRALKAILDSDKDWLREGWGGKFNNHYAHHKLFIGSYGLFYGKQEYVDYAIESDAGFRDLIENATRDDGLWHESSITYHFTGLKPIAQFAVELENAGNPLDLWNRRFANGRRLGELATGPIQTLFPDETIPSIGDTYGRRTSPRDNSVYFWAFNTFRDPVFGWVLRDAELPALALFLENLPNGDYPPPAMKTRLWPEHGYIALRTQEGADYWKGDGYAVFASFDLNGIHSHYDKFDLMVFGRGAHLAIDPEGLSSAPHGFSSRIQRELNRHTVSHNTVMVDGESHRGTSERLIVSDFIDGEGIKLATISDPKGLTSPGVRMMRTIAATPDYVLDVFQVTSDRPHTYDYLFHTYDDQGALAVEGEAQTVELGSTAPWFWLRNARQRTVDQDWQVTARQGRLRTRLLMIGEPGTQLITCDFPRSDDFQKPAIPMLLVRRKAKSTVFVALLQAERDVLPVTKASLRHDRFGSLKIAVEDRGRVREFLVKPVE